jgi:hypothetical protein
MAATPAEQARVGQATVNSPDTDVGVLAQALAALTAAHAIDEVQSQVLELPDELLHHVMDRLLVSEPPGIVRFASACKQLHVRLEEEKQAARRRQHRWLPELTQPGVSLSDGDRTAKRTCDSVARHFYTKGRILPLTGISTWTVRIDHGKTAIIGVSDVADSRPCHCWGLAMLSGTLVRKVLDGNWHRSVPPPAGYPDGADMMVLRDKQALADVHSRIGTAREAAIEVVFDASTGTLSFEDIGGQEKHVHVLPGFPTNAPMRACLGLLEATDAYDQVSVRERFV